MSVTLADILRLPSMSGAEIVAGERGIFKAVEAVNVIEYCDITDELEEFFKNSSFEGSELLITSFSSVRNSIADQSANIRRYHGIGAVGIILYYVGFILPEIDQSLIDICNELDFPLICMPKGNLNLRYSEAIGEILFEVFRDQQRERYFVSDLLDRMSKLPPHQRKLDALLRMLSDYLHSSVFLHNPVSGETSAVYWPRSLSETVEEKIDTWILGMKNVGKISVPLGEGRGHLHRCPRLSNDKEEPDIFLLKYGEELSEEVLWQSSELVRLFLHIWDSNRGKFVTTEIIRAIINNETLQMNRLSNLFHIDVTVLNQMWLFRPLNDKQHYDEEFIGKVSDQLDTFSKPVLISYYENNVVAFTHAPAQYEHRQEILEELYELLKSSGYDAVCWNCITTTTDARDAYLDTVEHLSSARKIYPQKGILSAADILFAKQCQHIVENPQDLERYLRILTQLRDGNTALLPTIETYLLDTYSNMAETAQKLFVHLNTIKYRLRTIQDMLGYVPGKMPDAYPLYVAVSLNRLMKQ